MKLCVVIPVHNEAREIGGIIASIRKKHLDVVVIDDGSCDGSGHIAREQGACVLVNGFKEGKGRSLQRGFAYCLLEGYTGVITMDGDGQHDPEDLDVFIKNIALDPVRIITGTRMGHAQDMPWLRRVTNAFMSILISRICRQNIPDTQCGFRYISAAILQEIQLTSRNFEIETEVLTKASQSGHRVHSIPVKTIYRDEVSKIRPVKDTVRFFVFLFREFTGVSGRGWRS